MSRSTSSSARRARATKSPATKRAAPPTRSRAVPVALEQLNARPDPIDFRDLMFEPTLVEVPQHITLDDYKAYFPRKKPPVLDQSAEGACTGFGLAAVAHFLLHRRAVD